MRELLPILPRPSRYTGIEDGAVHKDVHACTLRIALAFPDLYEVGMSYLGQKVLYGIVNAKQSWWAERVMAPCRDAAALLREHAKPLCTLESDTPLASMHLIGFSLTHELAYTNVLYMLDLAHIPLRASQRGDDLNAYPIILVGGGATMSAEPLAPFADLMVIGEGEEVMVDIGHVLERAHEEHWTRQHFLEEARHITGVYVPSLFVENNDGTLVPTFDDYTTVTRRLVTDLDKATYPQAQVVPIGAVHNRLALEIARGCTRGCRFCHAGIVYRPVRERSLKDIEQLLQQCLKATGFDEVSFLSLSTGDFSALKTLFLQTMDGCAREQVSVSLPSLRVGSIDDTIMQRMADIRRTGATLAPEAGSQRLRDVINKGITEEELMLHVQKLVEYGWRQVKLYFMIGLPTETTQDLDGIVELCQRVRHAAGKIKLNVTAAISPFVPKPFTPFQWEAQISLEEMNERVYYLRDAFKKCKGVRMRWHETAMSHLEGILSRGDRRLADVVEKAYDKGAIFASWVEGFSLEPWLEALAECGLSIAEYTGARGVNAPLAWDHLNVGVSTDFLRRERDRAFAEKLTSDCRYHACHGCGACDTKVAVSLLRPSETDEEHIHNIVNFAQRDQESHGLLAGKPESAVSHEDVLLTSSQKMDKHKPPAIAPELTVKHIAYRVWHTREDRAAFLSQLELQAILERALRRADIPMSFSQGFHPLPLISFGRALPVGVASQAEWFSIVLRRHLNENNLVKSLQKYLPRGMRVLRAVALPAVAREQRTVQSVREDFCVTYMGPEAGQADFLDKWRIFREQESYLWTRETKKGSRTVDIRAIMQDISVAQKEIQAVTEKKLHEYVKIFFTNHWERGYVSPLLLVNAVSQGVDPLHIFVEKFAQYFPDGSMSPRMF